MGCTLLIKECLNSLTETEQRLGCYLLDHTSEVIHMNAKEYASACASSPAAVVRFSKRLGFKGFTALKLDLARESGQGDVDDFQAVIRDNDDMETIVRKAERIHLQNTSLTYQMLNVSILSQAVEEICAGRRIHLFGVGASGLLAMDCLYKSSRIGIPATPTWPPPLCWGPRTLSSPSATAARPERPCWPPRPPRSAAPR